MNIAEYQKFTGSTAIYPGRGTTVGLMYVTLGLLSEIDELSRDFSVDEAGDVLWYVSEICNHTGTDMRTLDLTWSRDHIDIAGVVKKIYRDHTPMASPLINRFLGGVFWEIRDTLYGKGHTVAEALESNASKLQSRQARGVLSGSGDNR